jgi:hypothetical protein
MDVVLCNLKPREKFKSYAARIVIGETDWPGCQKVRTNWNVGASTKFCGGVPLICLFLRSSAETKGQSDMNIC